MSEFPVLIFGHRSNTAKWVDTAIENGANAIETDILLDGQQILAAHDDWRTSGKTNLDEFLNLASNRLAASERVVLWLFDLKTTMTLEKFEDLRTAVNNASFPDNVFKFYCITDATKHLVVQSLTNFGNMEGINFDADDNPFHAGTSIKDALAWRETHKIANFLYSAGIDSMVPDFLSNARDLLKEAIAKRARSQDFGVYTWTYDKEVTATEILTTLNLNGVMGNMDKDFGNLPNSIEAGKVDNVRLATRRDKIQILQ